MWLYTKATIGETCSISKFPRWFPFGAQHKVIAIDMVPFCCHLLQNIKCPPPRWFIESLFYYVKHKSFLNLCKISTCISFQNIAWLSMYNFNILLRNV